MGVGGVSPTPRPPLPPGKTRYPLYRRLGGPQGRSGRAENLIPTGIRSRTVQPVAQSLCQLSYRAHVYNEHMVKSSTCSTCYSFIFMTLKGLYLCLLRHWLKVSYFNIKINK